MWDQVAAIAMREFKSAKAKKEAFEALCASVSKEDADILRKERKERIAIQSQRAHEMRVAEASKPDSGSGAGAFGLGLILGLVSGG